VLKSGFAAHPQDFFFLVSSCYRSRLFQRHTLVCDSLWWSLQVLGQRVMGQMGQQMWMGHVGHGSVS